MEDYERNIQKLLAQLREVGRKVPNLYVYPTNEPTFGCGATDIDIKALEAVLTAPLPADYRYFQKTCGSISAADIGNAYFLHEISLAQRIMTDPAIPTGAFLDVAGSVMLPIGGDGGGNSFLISIGPSNYIAKWNHEINEQTKLADTFTEFLQRVLEDWEHFVAYDNNWQYMSG